MAVLVTQPQGMPLGCTTSWAFHVLPGARPAGGMTHWATWGGPASSTPAVTVTRDMPAGSVSRSTTPAL